MLFPVFVDMEGRHCLVVGGGAVAARKVRTLRAFGACVTVVASEIVAEIGNGVEIVRRPFSEGDVDGAFLVVVATDDHALNAEISDLCRRRNIPVNVVDDPALCSFTFPAIAQRGPIVAGVSSGGACPVATQVVRDWVDVRLTDDFVSAVERLGQAREELKRRFPDPGARKEFCEKELSKWRG